MDSSTPASFSPSGSRDDSVLGADPLAGLGSDLNTRAPYQHSPGTHDLHDHDGSQASGGFVRPARAADLTAIGQVQAATMLASLEADRLAITLARDANDNNALIERVHRLHGATRYCGVPQLRAACHRAETLLKQDDAKAQHALDELDMAIARLASEARVNA